MAKALYYKFFVPESQFPKVFWCYEHENANLIAERIHPKAYGVSPISEHQYYGMFWSR